MVRAGDGFGLAGFGRVAAGDQAPDLQAAYKRLNDLVLARRETFNRQFADLVVDWNRTPHQFPEILLIEDIQLCV